jgi:hypothetical protein
MTTVTSEKVKSAIVDSYRATLSFESKVNELLDELLTLQGELDVLNVELKNVSDLIEQYVGDGPTADKIDFGALFVFVDKLFTRATRLGQGLTDERASKLLPSVLKDFRDNLEQLEEIRADLEIMISDSPDLKSAEQRLIDLGF